MHAESAVLPAKQSQCDIAADQQQPSNAASQQQSCGYLCFSTILLTCGAGGASRCSPSLPETADTAPHHTDQRRRCINMPQLASVAFKAGQPARHAGGLGLYQSVVVWYRAQGTPPYTAPVLTKRLLLSSICNVVTYRH